MALIQHRVNKIADLKNLKSGLGAEIDLRSDVHQSGEMHLAHDAWVLGDQFSDWLMQFSHVTRGPLILNTKEDGLESRCMDLMAKHKIANYFFLDTTIPTLNRLSSQGLGAHLCFRFSKYEPEEMLKLWAGRVKWLWVDCFDGDLVLPSMDLLKKFHVCLVSPELQGQSLDLISKFKETAREVEYSVCTKRPDLW